MTTTREIDKFLSGLTFTELNQVISSAQARASGLEETAKQEAREKLADVAKDLGFEDIKDLFGMKSPRRSGADGVGKRAPAKIKYQNPKMSSENWSGRGRAPNWLVRELGVPREKITAAMLAKYTI